MANIPNGRSDHLVIASLLANPAFNNIKIAKMLGIHPTTVCRVKKRLEKEIQKNRLASEAYSMLLHEKVPMTARADKLARLIDGNNDFASLKTIQYVDEVTGVSPQRHQTQSDTDTHKPLFVLPQATNIVVNINRPADVIDVTPTRE